MKKVETDATKIRHTQSSQFDKTEKLSTITAKTAPDHADGEIVSVIGPLLTKLKKR